MAIPSRTKQIAEVIKLLDSDGAEGMSLGDLAARVVDGYHRILKSGLKNPVPPPHVGLAFKTPYDSHVQHIAWSDEVRVWIVSANSRYGLLGRVEDLDWMYMEESKAKAGAPGNNPHWKAGDRVSRNQRMYSYKVIATGDKCVLLESEQDGHIQADSNDNMAKYYRREVLNW